ncbi:MAG: FAD/NAD(P)-binding protein [bacterium]
MAKTSSTPYYTDRHRLYVPKIATVKEVRALSALEKMFTLEFEDRSPLGHSPGQFVLVSVWGAGEIPISVTGWPSDTSEFELAIRQVGRVTDAIHKLQPGAQIGIRGPVGRPMPLIQMENKDLLIIAGGIGIIPIRCLVKYVLDNRSRFGRVTLLYGAKRHEDLLFMDEINVWRSQGDIDVRITVDTRDFDWKGNVGVITTLIPGVEVDGPQTYAVVVGPPVMYKFVLLSLGGREIPHHQIILSLERRMKCGVGKCGHCQINDIYVCSDGPTFTYAELKRLPECIETL